MLKKLVVFYKVVGYNFDCEWDGGILFYLNNV